MTYLLLFLAGGLAALGLAPLNITPLLIAALVYLFLNIKNQCVSSAFARSYVFALGYFIPGLYWIGNAMLVEGNPYIWVWPFAVLGLPVALSIFPALAGALFAFIKNDKPAHNIISFAVCFTLLDIARGTLFTGFPWNLWGHGWSGLLPMLQTLSIWGVYGLTFFTLFVAACVAKAAESFSPNIWKKSVPSILALIAIVAVPYGWGMWRLSANPTEYTDKTIRVVQPNIPQHQKWDSRLISDHFVKALGLSKGAEDFIVWPESAFPAFFLDVEPAVNDWKSNIAPHQIVFSGTLRGEDKTYFNSLVAIDGDAKIINTYDKAHLVPFGEYIPFQQYIPIKPIARFSGFQQGGGVTTQTAGNLNYSALVCYEVIFTGRVINKKQPAPDILINVTNDAWYGISPGPYQHWLQAVYRAIEEGTPIVRSANTGISGLIDAHGRTIVKTSLFKAEAVTSKLPQRPDNQTIYSRVHYWVFIFFGLIWIIYATAKRLILLQSPHSK